MARLRRHLLDAIGADRTARILYRLQSKLEERLWYDMMQVTAVTEDSASGAANGEKV